MLKLSTASTFDSFVSMLGVLFFKGNPEVWIEANQQADLLAFISLKNRETATPVKFGRHGC